VQDVINDALSGFAARIEKPSPGAVSEKNAGVSVSVVDDCAHYVASDKDSIDPSGLAILDFAQPTGTNQPLWGEVFPFIDEANPRYP
jgi:hypothetical protein